ncbi:MAG: alpha/beta hydrolase [Sandaracinaceae bacterium]|nr:alpha/beta hydrolase [Sandaracinaceae bacterium]
MTPESPSDPPLRFAWTAAGPFAFTDEGAGPPLVLVHGLPGSSRDFRWLCSALGHDVRSIRVEQPGFGQTPWTTESGTTLAHRARFVLEAVDALGVDRFRVLGHSIGGPVAMAVAARAAARCDGLALIASVGLHPHRLARRTPRRPELARPLTWRPVQRLVLPELRRGFARAGFPASTPEGEMIQCTRVFGSLDFAHNRAAAFGVRAPSLIAWAEDDALVEPAIGLSLSQVLPDGPRLPFATGGHNIQKTRAVELADALRAWMRIPTA